MAMTDTEKKIEALEAEMKQMKQVLALVISASTLPTAINPSAARRYVGAWAVKVLEPDDVRAVV